MRYLRSRGSNPSWSILQYLEICASRWASCSWGNEKCKLIHLILSALISHLASFAILLFIFVFYKYIIKVDQLLLSTVRPIKVTSSIRRKFSTFL